MVCASDQLFRSALGPLAGEFADDPVYDLEKKFSEKKISDKNKRQKQHGEEGRASH